MIGSLMMGVSAVLFVTGMLGGIAMGIQHNFTFGPAHAHLNLIGGVMLFLFGLFYRVIPAAGASRLARVQGWLHIVGAVLFPLGIALSIGWGPAYTPVPVVGSLIVTAATLLFGVIVIRTARAEARSASHAPLPADRRHATHPASHLQPVRGIVRDSDSRPTTYKQDIRNHGQGIEG